MKYKCNGKMHLWGWIDFKIAVNGNIISYGTTGSNINYLILEVEKPIDKKICKEFGVSFKKVI